MKVKRKAAANIASAFIGSKSCQRRRCGTLSSIKKMKKTSIILFIIIFLFSCKEAKREYHLKTIFPNTQEHQINDKGEYVSISIEDKYYMLDKDYLTTKAQLISFQVSKNNPKVEKLNIQIQKGDSIVYERILDKKILQENFNLFDKNKKYYEVCKILFRDFDDSEFWNWRNSIHALSKFKSNKEKGCKDFFELLAQYSTECGINEFKENEVRAADFLKEGLRLINSAGMVNFWNQEELINQEELLKKANSILKLCNENSISKTDSIKIENGSHIIQSKNKN